MVHSWKIKGVAWKILRNYYTEDWSRLGFITTKLWCKYSCVCICLCDSACVRVHVHVRMSVLQGVILVHTCPCTSSRMSTHDTSVIRLLWGEYGCSLI